MQGPFKVSPLLWLSQMLFAALTLSHLPPPGSGPWLLTSAPGLSWLRPSPSGSWLPESNMKTVSPECLQDTPQNSQPGLLGPLPSTNDLFSSTGALPGGVPGPHPAPWFPNLASRQNLRSCYLISLSVHHSSFTVIHIRAYYA